LVVGVSLAVLLWATRGVVTQYSLGRSADDLRAAHAAFDRLVDSRAQEAARQTALVTELPTFRSAPQNRAVRADGETMNAVAKDYCGKLRADFCVITDARGAWIGQTVDRAHDRPALAGIVDGARSGQSASAAVTLSDGLFLVVAEPTAFDQNP